MGWLIWALVEKGADPRLVLELNSLRTELIPFGAFSHGCSRAVSISGPWVRPMS